MLSRRWLALLLEMDEADVRLSGMSDGQLEAIASRSLAAAFGVKAGDERLAGLQRAFREGFPPGMSARGPDKDAFCHLLHRRAGIGAAGPGVSFDEFEAAFGKLVLLLRNALAMAAGPQLIEQPNREFGVLHIGLLPQLQAPEELCGYMSGLVTSFRERQAISAGDADHVIGLVEKMVSAPGYLCFLDDDRKRKETARLLDLVMAVQFPRVPPGPATSDMIVTLGLLLHNISPSEKVAAGLAAVQPSAACPALQYHYHAIMALNYVLTGQYALAEGHAAAAGRSAGDAGSTAYISILQGCIALVQGDHEKAADRLEKAASGALGGRVKALACFYRGVIFAENEEYMDAIGCFQEAGPHATDPLDNAAIHHNIGSCACRLGDLALAELSFAEMDKLADRLGGATAIQCRLAARSHLGAIMHAKGEYPRAVECYRQALRLALRSGDGEVIANRLGNLGATYASAGEAESALSFLTACMTCSERLSYWPGIRFAYWHARRIAVANRDNAAAGKFLVTYASLYPELRDLR